MLSLQVNLRKASSWLSKEAFSIYNALNKISMTSQVSSRRDCTPADSFLCHRLTKHLIFRLPKRCYRCPSYSAFFLPLPLPLPLLDLVVSDLPPRPDFFTDAPFLPFTGANSTRSPKEFFRVSASISSSLSSSASF